MIDIHKSMTERNPVTLGVVGTLAIIVILVLSFNFRSLPVVNSHDTIVGEFGDASGLMTGDPVMIAGVEVGTVSKIGLSGNKVAVTMDVDTRQQRLGTETSAAIRVKTALGQRYVDLTPAGSGSLADGAVIPLTRTASGYDITTSLQELTQRVSRTDKETLSVALDQLSGIQNALPDDLRSSLQGVTRLSTTIASRDQELRSLLENSAQTTSVLADRNTQISAMMGQGAALFTALNQRANTIHRVIVQAQQISDALDGLSADVRLSMKPTLDQLNSVLDLLNRNYQNIDRSISGLKTFTFQLGEAVGTGPFFNVLLQNIVPATLSGQTPLSPGAPR
ncbi:MCE family protein [Gordonia westfalica]|uniref:Phospholipid/cholesterol/gamma-HCH transport system substrate-binding protein n=1 Tax=Gordonia westfalica TaxID=158898 RepID=A0A1H2LFF1_9ACTN|nr:MCE family protein [Gordonia westfalica]SDU79455.1 phospholipid/cholesterol/gamma-HCH transport system substrate-binding protein [Gordonia westfalica]